MDASGAGGGGSLLFVKEEVKPISETATTSLLSSSLASRPRNDAPVSSPMSQRVPMSPIKVDHTHRRAHRSREVFGDERKTASPGSAPVHSPAFHGLTPPASVYRAHRQRSRSVHAAPSGDVVPMTLAEDTGGFSVSHVIQTIVSACKPVLDKAPREYQLRISETEDSIIVDDDFPELDGTVELISVGVNTLLLTEASSERVVLKVSLPPEVVGLRREERAKLTAIPLMCTPTTSAAAKRVVVQSSLLGLRT